MLDGSVYDGHFKRDRRNGQGVMNYSNGDVYEVFPLNIKSFKFDVLKIFRGNFRAGSDMAKES